MNGAPKFSAIHEALVTRGFKQATTLNPLSYNGTLEIGNESLATIIEFPDLELLSLPTIRLLARPKWIPAACHHVNADNDICYASSKLAFIDRYDADRQVLDCLEKAMEVLRAIKHGHVLGDIDREFASYWHGEPILIDADVLDKSQELSLLTLQLAGRESRLVCGNAAEAQKKYNAFSPRIKALASALLLPVGKTPPVTLQQWPPQSLQQILTWLGGCAPQTLKTLRRALAGMKDRHGHWVFILFQAEPTWFGFSFQLPFDARVIKFRHAKDFLNSILGRSSQIEIVRCIPLRIDSRYLVERNLRDDERALLGKRILLVGCGTIGGHIAHALARAGAGFGGGALIAADPDLFTGGNIGRHRLGFEAVLQDKAQALIQDLGRGLPGITAHAVVGSALDLSLKEFDLIVDATGEEQLSEALNARFVAGQSAPIVYAWINGNGTSVQTFTLTSQEQGCLHCWKSHGSRADFIASDASNELDVRVGRGCDDPYAPFSGAAPLAAAGLATQAVLDWASGRPRPTLRSMELDYRASRYVKPKSPAKSSSCPACGPSR
jgi:molybdopterin/thiamine biosynthesis adenylyltransferase